MLRSLALLPLLATPALAQDPAIGATLFQRHCASCHGIEAKGDGPMAPVLILQPPDLTSLTQKYDGVFPVERIVARIDGRDPLVAHGSPMPVYGDFFDGVKQAAIKTNAGQPILVSEPMADLVAFLGTLQGP